MKKILEKFGLLKLDESEMKMIKGGDSCTTTCRNGDRRSVSCSGTCSTDANAAWCDDLMTVDICEY